MHDATKRSRGFTTNEAVELLALTPHMHLRGRSFRFEARRPNERALELLSVPRWDFNWQLTYVLEAPLSLPAGSEVVAHAEFDNSTGNRFNPDASRDVPWGRQVTDEMMTAWIELSFPANIDPARLLR